MNWDSFSSSSDEGPKSASPTKMKRKGTFKFKARPLLDSSDEEEWSVWTPIASIESTKSQPKSSKKTSSKLRTVEEMSEIPAVSVASAPKKEHKKPKRKQALEIEEGINGGCPPEQSSKTERKAQTNKKMKKSMKDKSYSLELETRVNSKPSGKNFVNSVKRFDATSVRSPSRDKAAKKTKDELSEVVKKKTKKKDKKSKSGKEAKEHKTEVDLTLDMLADLNTSSNDSNFFAPSIKKSPATVGDGTISDKTNHLLEKAGNCEARCSPKKMTDAHKESKIRRLKAISYENDHAKLSSSPPRPINSDSDSDALHIDLDKSITGSVDGNSQNVEPTFDRVPEKNAAKEEDDGMYVQIDPEVVLMATSDEDDANVPCKSSPSAEQLNPNTSSGKDSESNRGAHEGDSFGDGKANFSGETGDQVKLVRPRRSKVRASKHYNPFELIDDGVFDEDIFNDGEDDQDTGEESLMEKENIVIGSSAGGETYVKCGKCDSLVLEANLDGHLATHANIYPCQFCNYKAHNPTDAKQHLRSHRRTFLKADGSYMCKLCDKTFDSLKGVWKHHQIMHASDIKCCVTECGKIFRGLKAYMLLHIHYQHCHPEILGKKKKKIYKCNVCGETFKTCSLKYAHQERKHKKEKNFFECAPCGFKFPQQFHLLRHMSSKSHQKKVTRMISLEANVSIETLSPSKFSMTSEEERVKKCDHCEPTADKKAISGSCDICGFICTGCLEVFETYLRAQRHKHKYVCNECCKMCHTKQELSLHREFHNQDGMRWYCNDCEFGYTSFRPYLYHMKISHNQIVTKEMAVSETDAQRRSPPEEVMYDCTLCNRRFRKQQSLYMHCYRRHTRHSSNEDDNEGEKPEPQVGTGTVRKSRKRKPVKWKRASANHGKDQNEAKAEGSDSDEDESNTVEKCNHSVSKNSRKKKKQPSKKNPSKSD